MPGLFIIFLSAQAPYLLAFLGLPEHSLHLQGKKEADLSGSRLCQTWKLRFEETRLQGQGHRVNSSRFHSSFPLRCSEFQVTFPVGAFPFFRALLELAVPGTKERIVAQPLTPRVLPSRRAVGVL